jgi:predicted O-methyltransferase YrrM
VADPAAQDPDILALREFNELVRDDSRADVSLLPVADGIP